MVIKQSYLCMKMPSPFGIITVHEDQVASRQIEGKPIPGYSLINEVVKKPPSKETDSKEAVEPRAKAAEETLKTPLSALVPKKCVHIGSDLAKGDRDSLIAFLHENQDVFTWSANDLQSISRDLA
jgi:hypothetical protein